MKKLGKAQWRKLRNKQKFIEKRSKRRGTPKDPGAKPGWGDECEWIYEWVGDVVRKWKIKYGNVKMKNRSIPKNHKVFKVKETSQRRACLEFRKKVGRRRIFVYSIESQV